MIYRFAACAALVLSVCLILSIPLMAQAQSSERSQTVTGSQAQATDKAQKISQALNLSPQQQSQVTPILENEDPKVQDIKSDTNLNTDQKQARIKKVYEDTDKLVKPILTPVQWKQWEQYRKNELSNIK
jgi:uncharacterized membrane protein YhiD involved in acid resistance